MKRLARLLSESPNKPIWLPVCLSPPFFLPRPQRSPWRLLHPRVPSSGSALQEAAVTEDTCYMLPGNKMLPENCNPPLTLHRPGTSR